MKAIQELSLQHKVGEGSFATVFALDIGVYKHYKEQQCKDSYDARRFIPLELSILRALNQVPFFVQMEHIIHDNQTTVGVTMTRYKTNLSKYIENKQHKADQKIMYHLLNALYYLHSIDVLHGDIKPGNVLLDQHNNALLCDFNSCHMLSPVNTKSSNYMYTYTLWYRPPEVFLQKKIDLQADVWSLGIVFCEMIIGRVGMLATTEEMEDNYVTNKTIFMRQLKTFGTPLEYTQTYPQYKPRYELFFQKIGISKEPSLCSLIRSMLQIMPHQRDNPKQLLNNQYFTSAIKIEPLSTPQYVISQADVLYKTPYKSYYNEMNNLKEAIRETLTESYKYYSITTLQYEAIHFAHYIFVLTNNNKEHSIQFQLGVCLIIALKILDPSNYYIDEVTFDKATQYEQEILSNLDYKVHFQNTLYYQMHQQGPLTKELNDLLYASLFASYPEEFNTTKQVMEAVMSGKQNQNKYYKDLQKIVAKNESILKSTKDEPNK